jgi:hypothetical protein
MMGPTVDWPELSLPEAEAECLREAYRSAQVILEYGSGGSTVFAAQQTDKLVFSVESDREWALNLQRKIDEAELPAETILYHVDIGQTGRWGRPKDDRSWRRFHRYPAGIWAEPFFREPEVILIDGRLRPACLVNSCMRASRPITVLFDDYGTRPMYHIVEVLLKPTYMVGRMGVFHVTPQEWPKWTENLFLELCTLVSLDSDKVDYSKIPELSFIEGLQAG